MPKSIKKAVDIASSRHARRKSNLAVAEGLRVCNELLDKHPEWIEAITLQQDFADSIDGQKIQSLAKKLNCKTKVLANRDFNALTETINPQGILITFNKPDWQLPEQLPNTFVLVLDRIAEPGNLGTILRTAWAVGLEQVWLVKGGADPFSPKVVRAGMGAQFALQLPTFQSLKDAKQHFDQLGGKTFWLTLPNATISLFDQDAFDFTQSALVIGNEANGVSDTTLGPGVTIPMPGHAESLNAAQAATVFLCEAVRRQTLK